MAAEAIYKLSPHRTIHMRGFDRRGAAAAICEASATGFKAYGTYRDMADFAVVMLWDADNFFEHARMKYLPDFDFSGMVLTFDLEVDGIQPIDSPKFNWIDWRSLDVVRTTGEPVKVDLFENARLQAGAFDVAAGVLNFQTASPQGFDRVTLWHQNVAFDYIAPAGLKMEVEYQFFAAGSGTVHSITVDGRTYGYTELPGDGSADVANGLVAAVAGDPDVTAVIGSASYAVLLTNVTDAGTTYSVTATGGTPETLYRFGPGTVARAIRDQVNGANWVTLGGTYALLASTAGAALTLKAARYGTVNVSGTAVSWASGSQFQGVAAGGKIIIAGAEYTISTVNSATSITLTASAGTATGARYQAERGGYDGNMLNVYAIAKNGRLNTAEANVHFSGGSSAVTWRISIDFTALGIDSIRQAWLTLAPRLADGADFADTEWTATVSNWSVSDPGGRRPIKVAGAGSVRAGSRDAWATYSGSGWAERSANNLYRGFARTSKTTGDKVTVRYSCQATHDLYVGTALYRDRGIVSVRLDGDTATDLDCYAAGDPEIATRRKIRTAVPAGEHVAEFTVSGTKHTSLGAWDANATDYYFVFDYLEAAIAADVPDPAQTYADLSPALDYSTDHTYKQTPQRLLWSFDRLGFHGHMNEYLGVFWWNERVRANATWSTLTVQFGGTWADGDAAFIDIGGFVMGKSVFPADTSSTIATHFRNFINGALVAMWAETTGTAGELLIHVRTPVWGDTNSVSISSAAGTVSTSGSLVIGDEGDWIVNPAAAEAINWPTRKWHADLYAEVAARGRLITTAISMELVNPPDDPGAGEVWAARYLNGVAVETDVGFASLKTTHCSFVPKVLAYQKRVLGTLAGLQDAAGLTPWIQFGEFLWWFFSAKALVPAAVANSTPVEIYFTMPHGLTTGATILNAGYRGCTAANGHFTVNVVNAYQVALDGSVGNGTWVSGSGGSRTAGMAFYDDETDAAAVTALGRPLASFYTQDDDPTVNGGADVAFLQAQLKAHIDALRADVLATYPGTKFELLYPYDVHHPDCYYTDALPFPQGGRLNAVASLPPAFKAKTGSGLDRMKVEALSWGSFYRHLDRAKESIDLTRGAGWTWPTADVAYLVPWFNGGCPWPAEFLHARARSLALVNFWALDHLCLMTWPVEMPKPDKAAKIF